MNDVSQFRLLNVGDTCSLWNLLASPLLYVTARAAGMRVCCTNFVVYECLHKRGQPRPERLELQRRLKSKLADGTITAHPIELEDLQQVEVLQNRKKLSIGELSVLVFAGKTQQAMLTDDKGAQKFALTYLAADAIQSTPHLVAWLYFGSLLADADVVQVKAELTALARNLDPHFDKFYCEAQRCRAVAAQGARLQGSQNPKGGTFHVLNCTHSLGKHAGRCRAMGSILQGDNGLLVIIPLVFANSAHYREARLSLLTMRRERMAWPKLLVRTGFMKRTRCAELPWEAMWHPAACHVIPSKIMVSSPVGIPAKSGVRKTHDRYA